MSQNYPYKERFNQMNDNQLIDAFNCEVGKDGWVGARAAYFTALHDEFKKRYDYSAIGDKLSLSFKNKVKLIDKVIKIAN